MNYEQELNEYIDQVNRLYLQAQSISEVGLTPEQVAQLRSFQRENAESRETLNREKGTMIVAYSLADANGKKLLENELRKRRQGLDYAERVFRSTTGN